MHASAFQIISQKHSLEQTSSNTEPKIAQSFLDTWSLSRQRPIFAVADLSVRASQVISGVAVSDALVVAIRGQQVPLRRNATAGQAYVSVLGANATEATALSHSLALSTINRAALLLEAAIGRPLFAYRLEPVDMTVPAGSQAPFAVYDVSHGHIMLDRRRLASILNAPAHVTGVVERFATSLYEQLAAHVTTEAHQASQTVSKLAGFASKAGALAAAVAFASAIPTWFCIACPAVLGLLAPFLFNFGFGEGAELLCQHYQLPDDACNELWLGAFALALVLSLASTIPIVYICRLPECGKQR